MSNPIKIAVDAMGGDNSPNKVIKGIYIHSLNSHDTFYKIFGDENIILPLLNKYKISKHKFEVVHTKNIIKELFVKYYEKFESDLKSKIPTVVKSQEKSWTDLSHYMISLQKKIIEIRTKYLKSYKQLIHDEKVKLTIKREKLEKLFSAINHFLDINNIDPRSWESSSNFPSISEVKQMSLGPKLLSKIQIGDGDQIKGFPKIRDAFFEDLKNNSLNESNLPQPTNR